MPTNCASFEQKQNDSSRRGADYLVKDILIPFGSALIAAVVVLSTTQNLPFWATLAMVVYLVFVFVLVLASPISKVFRRFSTWNSRRIFAQKMRSELLGLIGELNGLLDQQKTNTLPYVVFQLTQKLSANVRLLTRLDRNLREFQILQSWADSLFTPFLLDRRGNLWSSFSDLSIAVVEFTWACSVLRQDVINVKDVEENTSALQRDLKPDWDAAIHNIVDFTSRLERFMKKVNERSGTNLCKTSFQEVKPL